jgi:hypothetical protein
MTRPLFAVCAALLVGAGLALADDCPGACPSSPPCTPMPPVRLWLQPVGGPEYVPGSPIRGPTLFQGEFTPPEYTEGRPRPPVVLFHRPLPVVPLFTRPVPPVPLFCREPTPPEPPPCAPPRPGVTVFPRWAEPPDWGPPLVRPSVTIWHQPTPPYAEEEGCPACPAGAEVTPPPP